jgi:hypothetical protein
MPGALAKQRLACRRASIEGGKSTPRAMTLCAYHAANGTS